MDNGNTPMRASRHRVQNTENSHSSERSGTMQHADATLQISQGVGVLGRVEMFGSIVMVK